MGADGTGGANLTANWQNDLGLDGGGKAKIGLHVTTAMEQYNKDLIVYAKNREEMSASKQKNGQLMMMLRQKQLALFTQYYSSTST